MLNWPYLIFILYINLVKINNYNNMEDNHSNYGQLKSEYDKLKAEYDKLKAENDQMKLQANPARSPLERALERKIINSMMGTEYIEGEELNDVFQREIRNNPHLCDSRRFSWNCCFSKNTKIIVNENGNISQKNIYEIKKDDLILTIIDGEKQFKKVEYTKEYDDEFEFYEFKCVKDGKIKSITVTNNHIMIVYDKNMEEKKYKTAEKVIKNNDYFYTTDGLYQVIEINISYKKYKYALGVDGGTIVADDILISCLNMNDVSKNLSLNDMIEKYKVNIL